MFVKSIDSQTKMSAFKRYIKVLNIKQIKKKTKILLYLAASSLKFNDRPKKLNIFKMNVK